MRGRKTVCQAVRRQPETETNSLYHGTGEFFADAEMRAHRGFKGRLTLRPRRCTGEGICRQGAGIDFRPNIEDFLFVPLVLCQFPIKISPGILAAPI